MLLYKKFIINPRSQVVKASASSCLLTKIRSSVLRDLSKNPEQFKELDRTSYTQTSETIYFAAIYLLCTRSRTQNDSTSRITSTYFISPTATLPLEVSDHSLDIVSAASRESIRRKLKIHQSKYSALDTCYQVYISNNNGNC